MAKHLTLDTLLGKNQHGGLVRAGRCGGAAPAQGRAKGPDAQLQWSGVRGQGSGVSGTLVVSVRPVNCGWWLRSEDTAIWGARIGFGCVVDSNFQRPDCGCALCGSVLPCSNCLLLPERRHLACLFDMSSKFSACWTLRLMPGAHLGPVRFAGARSGPKVEW